MAIGRLKTCGLITAAALGASSTSQAIGQLGEGNPPPGVIRGNLLLNPSFRFHSFENHRSAKAGNYQSHNAAFWNAAAWGDITVMREAHVSASVRPSYSVGNLIRIAPGTCVWQVVTLPEAGLAHGTSVSLHVFGYQEAPNDLAAQLTFLKLDSEDGEWCPSDFGMADKRTFPRHARGELVAAAESTASAEGTGRVETRIEGFPIPGSFHADQRDTSHTEDTNTIALRVAFLNRSDSSPVWVWWPSLAASESAVPLAPAGRPMTPWYRHIPRTMQKLWKGESLHIILMGSSIDRGSANPPMYLYDETPGSPTFKQPLSDRTFEADLVSRPDLGGYIGWWQHYFNYAGRLRLELLRKYDLPVSKICLNVMACDGSCVGEAHSGLEAYCSLASPPSENANGHAAGQAWEALYPELFSRPSGPGPDLVIFGSGANEKTDSPDEVAVFEGAMRWIQRHYPHTEFLFCMFQNQGGYTPNAGDLQALSLHYQVPFLDYGRLGDDLTRWCNRYALVPRDGHPQASAHYLWFKQIEKAFECWEPIGPGQRQQYLPERLHANTYGWEGDMVTFPGDSPRVRTNMFIFEDTAVNCWGKVDEGKPIPRVDGVAYQSRRSTPRRDVRNSMFRFGRTSLGDRHILEIEGPGAVLTAVDAKVCPGRRLLPVDAAVWELAGLKRTPFESVWGSPYGSVSVDVPPGTRVAADVVATDLSVAYVDQPEGGGLRVVVDGQERLLIETDKPYTDAGGRSIYLENRKGILGLPYGIHRVELEAVDRGVRILGLFTYDSRPNNRSERRLRGTAAAGETVRFSTMFSARPLVFCLPPLAVRKADIHRDRVTFSGEGEGFYEVIGE